MKSFILVLSTILFFQLSVAAQAIKGSGKVVEQERNIQNFSALTVEDGIDLHIAQGKGYTVRVKADDNLVEYIKTEVKGENLIISSSARRIHNVSAFDVYVTLPSLSSVEASGGSDVFTENLITADALSLRASGGSDLKMELSVKSLDCEVTGGSDAMLSGDADELRVKASGGSDFEGKKLKSKRAKVMASGGSDAMIYATDEVDLVAQGGSDIYHSGGAKVVHEKSSGSSDIHHRN